MTADTVQTLSPRDWACHPAHIDPGYKSTGLRGPKHALVPMKHALAERNGAYRVMRRCPHCAESIKAAARVCKHCGRDVMPGA